jgi:hypothetical protein
MLYLFWSLLNIGLFIFFLAICFKATKFVREKLGLLAAIIFVIGLSSFVGNTNNDNDNKEPNSNQIKTWKFVSEDSLRSKENYLHNIILEKTPLAKYLFGIKYGKVKEGKINVPISAYSFTNGFVSGTNWKPISIIVDMTDDNNKFEYAVDGVLEWKLLGTTVYSELKEYKGIAMIK